MRREPEEKFSGFSQDFHSLLDAMPDALLLIDREMKVLWGNSAAEALATMTDGGLVGEHCFTLLRETSAPCDNCHALQTFQTGQSCCTQISSPGGRFWDVSTFPVSNADGGVDKVILTYRDVTEKLTLQAEALRAGHLASLGELAAGVAHEINNPANGIINYAQILHDDPGDGQSVREMAVRIIKEGNRIATIVQSLLSFARDSQETKSPLSIAAVLADALALTEIIILKNGIHLKVDCAHDLPPVLGHGQQIQQVFLNVVNNARYALNAKYDGTSRGKRLEIRGEETTVKGVPMVRITFWDQGVGIAPDMLDKVFHPFFSTKPMGEGTGLGLSISHSIIRDHGGRISIDSVEGEYTRLTIDLPAASGEYG
ncbi:MAG: ATP-binding protein [bacterium]|nr:ATP-binding protein [bacterium]